MESILRAYLEAAPHGASADLCENTELTKSVLSNWLHGRGNIAPEKLVQAVDWLIQTGKLSFTIHA